MLWTVLNTVSLSKNRQNFYQKNRKIYFSKSVIFTVEDEEPFNRTIKSTCILVKYFLQLRIGLIIVNLVIHQLFSIDHKLQPILILHRHPKLIIFKEHVSKQVNLPNLQVVIYLLDQVKVVRISVVDTGSVTVYGKEEGICHLLGALETVFTVPVACYGIDFVASLLGYFFS